MLQLKPSELFERVRSLVTSPSDGEFSTLENISSLCDDLEWYRQAYKAAEAHVVRQEHAGKHEQDRIDAIEWVEKWGNRND